MGNLAAVMIRVIALVALLLWPGVRITVQEVQTYKAVRVGVEAVQTP